MHIDRNRTWTSYLLDYRLPLLLGWHSVLVAFSLILAFLLRFDFDPPAPAVMLLYGSCWIAALSKTAVFAGSGVIRGWWRQVGIQDLLRIFMANVLASGLFSILVWIRFGSTYPRSIYAIDFLLCFFITAGSRFAVRVYKEGFRLQIVKSGCKGVLVYGAGAAGVTLLKEIRSNPALGYKVIGFLDDNPRLWSAVLMNTPVLGPGRSAVHIVDRYRHRVPKVDEIIIAMPSATGRQMRDAVANCRATGVPSRTIPGMGELLKGRYLSSQIRKISLDDLLGREQVRLDGAQIEKSIAGKSVLVTGAAGSIGSELCRQIGGYNPSKLVAFDQAESDLFRLDCDLRKLYPALDIVSELGDIRDLRRVEEVVHTHTVESVFHAAAYKHVPMLEAHTLEAVKNNILGTWNLVKVAHSQRVSNFLMISSDKAVNPTNIMGATKRIAELIVSAAGKPKTSPTTFVSVRFGNVLGSNGSVVPLFQAQIAAGGPVTVTHSEVRRYFMSVREAVQLVLQAYAMGNGTEIFVLDMGEPVRILDLAHNMIRLAGLVPGEDVEVKITGLRPGEKLFEELMLGKEHALPTFNDKIKILNSEAPDPELIVQWINRLQSLVAERSIHDLVQHIRKLVPEYEPQGSIASEPERPTAADAMQLPYRKTLIAGKRDAVAAIARFTRARPG